MCSVSFSLQHSENQSLRNRTAEYSYQSNLIKRDYNRFPLCQRDSLEARFWYGSVNEAWFFTDMLYYFS